ncbi:hypothetical protein SAMN05216567_10312 [Variovorax sp. OK605]|uniref:hypothetical protein n=1 Tax=Variovorax sp. OK605 TaxID=1855317 RepID=UPI0008E42520|nr:hypothetical protein [Variovorax sp. OK605]SFO84829.1 hypothetical protein SAMN05216567_10312 [Variovorax sp. OK605]
MKLLNVELTHEDGKDFAAWSNTGEVPAAEAVERLIRVLAETRKTMEPAFAETLPLLIKDPPQVDGAAWQWSIEADGSLVLNLRHPGLGWLGFRMRDVDLFHENLANVLEQRNALQGELRPPAA